MNRILTILSLNFFFINCKNKTAINNAISIPIDGDNITIVNRTDQSGKKQGKWQELDTVYHRISKEFYYKDDLLDSTYLIYKKDSPDTLILGYYKLGKKIGEWKHWNIESNYIEKTEIYENDTLKKAIKH